MLDLAVKHLPVSPVRKMSEMLEKCGEKLKIITFGGGAPSLGGATGAAGQVRIITSIAGIPNKNYVHLQAVQRAAFWCLQLLFLGA